MQALFIGQTYIDVTFLTDRMPTGDEKHVASAYAVSFGGNAVTAAFCCAKLGIVPDLLATVADDWLGRMFLDMAARYGIPVHARKVKTSSLSFIMPNDGKRAIVRCRDDDYLHPFPILHLSGCRALHLDGPQPDAAIHYAKQCREAGIFTSLDGGGLRSNTHELLAFIDVALVAERLCQQMEYKPAGMLDYLKGRGCRIGGVTLGERGLVWYDEKGAVRTLPGYGRIASLIRAAPETCFTAPTSIHTLPIRPKIGRSIFASHERQPHSRSSILAMRQACRPWPKSPPSTTSASPQPDSSKPRLRSAS